MAIYFMGGEDIDFLPNGSVSVVQGGVNLFRSDFARCALAVPGGDAIGAFWKGTFDGTASTFWFGCRVAPGATSRVGNPGQPLIVFYDGTMKRLGLSFDASGAYVLGVWDSAGAYTKLATSAGSQPTDLHKLDVRVSYAVQGAVRVFVNQVEILTFAGDVTKSGAVSLSSFALCCSSGANETSYFSEVVCTDRDTRTLMLKTHAPDAAGSSSQWNGSYTDIDETAVNEADGVSTNVVDQVSTFSIADLPALSNLAIRGFKVSGYAARGESGPQHIALGVKTANATTFSGDLAVDTGWTRLGKSWEQNPETNATWTKDDINNLQIAIKSRT